MQWLHTLHQAVDRLAMTPGIRQLGRRRHARRFLHNTDENLFLGVFDSFEAAAAAAPHAGKLGYDNDDSANLPYTSVITPRDYPAMFWLGKSFSEGLSSVFDLGGHIGVKYYAFRRALGYPAALRWTVCDVPAVVARGRELALARAPEGRLLFTSDYDAAADHEVLFASGSLQYLPFTLAELLRRLPRLPRRLVINGTPIHESRAFFTLNSIGTAFCPYRVQAREAFVADIRALGYAKRDDWENTAKALTLPFQAGYDVPHYSGFCFDLP